MNRNNIFIFFLLFVGLSQTSNAQSKIYKTDESLIKIIEQYKTNKQFDSLIIWGTNHISLNSGDDKHNLAILHKEIAHAYLEFGNLPFAEREFLMANKYFEQIGEKEKRANVLICLIDLYLKSGNFPAAQSTTNKALLLIDSKKDALLYAKAIGFQGIISWNAGDYEQSFHSHFSSLTYARLAKDSILIAENFKNIGNGYFTFKNYLLANNYYIKALEIYIKKNNFVGIATIYNNLGEIQRDEANYNKAIHYHLLAAKNDSLSNDTHGLAYDFANLMEDYLKLDKLDSAFYYYELAILLANQTTNNHVKAIAYINNALLFKKKGQIKQAEIFYLRAEKIIDKLKSFELQARVYKSLESLYIEQSNYKKAHLYANKFSVSKEKQNSNILLNRIEAIDDLESEIHSEIEKLNNSTSLAKNVYTKQRYSIFIAIFLLVISIVSIIFTYGMYKNMRKKNIQLAIQNKTITKAETNLQLVNKELKSLVNKFQNVVAHLPILVYGRNKKGEIVFWNKEAEKNTQYKATEIIKHKNALKLLIEEKHEFELLENAMKGGSFNWIETSLRSKNGELKRIAWSGVGISAPITDWEDWGIGIDISSRYQFEKYLEREKAVLNSIVNSIPYMIFYKRVDGVYIGANPAFTKFYGHKLDIVGKKDEELYGESEALRFRKIEKQIINNKTTFSEEKWINMPNGEKHLIHTIKFPFVNNHGDILGIVGLSRDITERFEFEQELQRQKEKAENADNLKSAFLANMSHEIRTPLNSIIGFADLLKYTNLTIKQREKYVEYINNSGNNLLNLIDDIIDTAKIEAGQLKIRKGRVFINRLLEEILATHREIRNSTNKHHVELILVKSISDKNLDIYTDSFRLRQILANLINNALKFVDKGHIEFGYKQDGSNLLFYVEDTGIGISEEKHELIFERFGQIESSYKKNFQGTGLGLAISKKLVILLGGKIWLKSEENKGATFYFTIPFVKSKVEENEFKNISELSHYNFNNKTILIAEDDRLNYIVLKNTLEHTKSKIVWKHNGQEAVDYIIEAKANNIKIDLILMDIQMPILNGYEASKIIRKLNENIPIIALTAYALTGEKEKTIVAGCSDYMTKPFKANILLKTISKYLCDEKS